MRKLIQKAAALTCIAMMLSVIVPFVPTVHATSTTCTPNGNVETVSVDGHTQAANGDWATARAATTGYTAFDSLTYMNVGAQDDGGGTKYIFRAIILCDLSGIPDTDIITGATLTLVSESTVSGGGAYDYVAVVGASNPASNTAIVADDYDQVGSTVMSNTVALSTWSTGTSKTFTLNASGIANISLTGISKFGLKGGNDIDNVAPGVGVQSTASPRSGDHATSADRPVFTVTHEPAASTFVPIATEDFACAKPEPFFDFA